VHDYPDLGLTEERGCNAESFSRRHSTVDLCIMCKRDPYPPINERPSISSRRHMHTILQMARTKIEGLYRMCLAYSVAVFYFATPDVLGRHPFPLLNLGNLPRAFNLRWFRTGPFSDQGRRRAEALLFCLVSGRLEYCACQHYDKNDILPLSSLQHKERLIHLCKIMQP
jgi:hypothetical protein